MEFTLTLLPETYAVCQLPLGSPLPPAPNASSLYCLQLTDEEISLVCPTVSKPAGAVVQDDWRALKIVGPLPFHLTGILHGVLTPLAAAEVPIFSLSTFNTDYVLVAQSNLRKALTSLMGAGFTIEGAS